MPFCGSLKLYKFLIIGLVLYVENLGFLCLFLGSVLVPLQASIAYPSSVNAMVPGYSSWDEPSLLISPTSSKISASLEEFANLQATEGMHSFFISFVRSVLLFRY